MKKILKILIGISILFLLLGTAYAIQNNEKFTAPSGLHKMGYNDFVDEKGHNIMIMNYTDDNIKTWFENDTDPYYLVEPYSGNESFYLGVDDENDCYILEVVEKDGCKYIIGSWTPKGAGETPTILSNLLEFNKLNKLNPINI